MRLWTVHRGYAFDRSKIGPGRTLEPIAATTGQVGHEWEHLLGKLAMRSEDLFDRARRRKAGMPAAVPRVRQIR